LSGVAAEEVSSEHPLWQVSAAAIKRAIGRHPVVNPMHTTSDIRNPIVQANIPCVGLGCLGGNLSQNGQHDEWVNLADFSRMVQVATDVARDWCSREAL
jgi:acetylornithine deacetylase